MGCTYYEYSDYNVLLCKHKRRNSKRFRLLRKKQSEVN